MEVERMIRREGGGETGDRYRGLSGQGLPEGSQFSELQRESLTDLHNVIWLQLPSPNGIAEANLNTSCNSYSLTVQARILQQTTPGSELATCSSVGGSMTNVTMQRTVEGLGKVACFFECHEDIRLLGRGRVRFYFYYLKKNIQKNQVGWTENLLK